MAAHNPKNKVRIDVHIVEKGLVQSRQRAKALIMAGKVFADQTCVDKPGTLIDPSINIIIKQDDNPFVSRGGLKLQHALDHLDVSAKDKICLDIGASTGGFTDCLLQYGAKKVYAVDVGYGQLDWKLRQDPRVVVIERTNIRHMPPETIEGKVDVVVADTSFISLKIVLVAAEKFMKKGALVLALIKPQFEAGKQHVGKGGVVRDEAVRKQVVDDISAFFTKRGYIAGEVVPSPVPGPKGNREFIIHLNFQEK